MTNTQDTAPFSIHLAIKGAAEAISFYQRAFDAAERYRLTDPANGEVSHAEIDIHGSLVMLSEENPSSNKSPLTLGACPVKLCLLVEDADAAIGRAVEAGAEVIMPAGDQFYGYRCGTVRDPYGYEWMIQHLIEEISPDEMQRRWNEMVKRCEIDA